MALAVASTRVTPLSRAHEILSQRTAGSHRARSGSAGPERGGRRADPRL